MKITQASMILLASSLALTGCSKKSGKKSGNGAPSRPAVSQEANERAEKVVPADFVNSGSGVDDVKESLTSQTETIKGPGANLGLDQSSNPKTVVKTLIGKGLISKAANTVMNSELSLSLADPVRQGAGSTSANSKEKPILDTQTCDTFFSSIDQVIDSSLKSVRSSLASVNEEEILKMEGASKGERLPNEAFRYNLVDAKEGTKATLSGGSNDTSAFIKVSGEAKLKTELTTTEEGTDGTQFPDDSSEGNSSFLAASPETQTLEGLLAMNAAILVDSKSQLMRVGGGIAFLGKTGNDPMSTKASTFVELAGGPTPGVSLEFNGELNGKLGAENPAIKMAGDYKFSLVQGADKSFRSELKSNLTASNGKDTETTSMTMATEMGVLNGKCVVKKVECASVPSSSCDVFKLWSMSPPSL